jgi:glutathione S-transferase
MSTPILVSLNVSPWSERARWALDHHGIVYRERAHVPFLGERKLRKLIGDGKKRATVPVLLTDDEVVSESWDIARYADRMGKGTPLFPAGRDDEVRHLVALADHASDDGRALVTRALLHSPAALDETLPPSLPAVLRPLLRPLARYGTAWFAKKYALRLDDDAPALAGMRGGLDTLRAALAGRDYLLGSFSWADIVLAMLLQGVKPVEHPAFPIGPGTRATWTCAPLAEAYPDLLAWRDALYARHRGTRAR